MAWLAGWSYAKDISITGQAGAGTLYQVDLEIGSSAGGDFHLENHCTNFPQDVEITDNDGTTLLDFWIEDIAADPIRTWVKVADDLGSNQIVRVYYGKAGHSTNGDIGAMGVFGDDFPGASVDAGKWTIAGSPAVSGGIVTCSPAADEIKTNSSFSNSHSLRARVTNQSAVSGGAGLVSWFDTDKYDYVLYGAWPTASVINAFRTSGGLSSFSLGHSGAATYLYELQRSGTQCAVHEYQTGADVTKGTITGGTSGTAKVCIGGDGASCSTSVDWVFVRKYVTTEPAFASAGGEQTSGAVASPTSIFYGPFVGPLGGVI